MIKDQDILFVTTTLYTKWLSYQKELVKKHFPESEHIVIDGRNNWPYTWFHWLNHIKNTTSKWFVHLDEDCFLNSREELLDLIQKKTRILHFLQYLTAITITEVLIQLP